MTKFNLSTIDYRQYEKALLYIKNEDFKLFYEAKSKDPENSTIEQYDSAKLKLRLA